MRSHFSRVTLFLLLVFVASIAGAQTAFEITDPVGGGAGYALSEDPDRFAAVFLSMASPEEPAKLAVQWTGDPSARLAVWVDFDGDGIWDDSEKVLENAALKEGMVLLDVVLPPGLELLPELVARFRVSGKGEELREMVQAVGNSGFASPLASNAGAGVPGKGAQDCEWASGFHVQGLAADSARASVVFDDGRGPGLYIAGDFTIADNVVVNRIAKWDGTSWTALGAGMNGSVMELGVHDDGSGSALFAAGAFTTVDGVSTNRIAKWDGATWTALGTGMDNAVWALAEHDDGSGTALYAAGNFSDAGGVSANRIAKWDGTSWTALGAGMNNTVFALTEYDDGSGSALYAGGFFTTADGVSASRIAKWDGRAWIAVGSGLNNQVFILSVHDDGNGSALFAGGSFTTAGGVGASRIAKWDGTSWASLGMGVDSGVLALTEYDDGSGSALFAAGVFTIAGGASASRIAKWDGTAWSVPSGAVNGDGLDNTVFALTEYDDGSGSALFAAGLFATAGGASARNIAKWDGTAWMALEEGLNGVGAALTVFDDGSGPALYVAGSFTTAGGVSANRIAKWDGIAWTALGDGLNDTVLALAEYDDGSGPALYAAGDFTIAGGVSASRIAKWDGTSWGALGAGLDGRVLALVVYDDGGGPAFFAGGDFTSAGGVSANRVARWGGTAWTALEDGLNDMVLALAEYDDGSGPALYAAGDFTAAGGVSASRIAKWDGTSWRALGADLNSRVLALVVHDDGGGPALYAAGDFTIAGGVSANRIAKWDGTAWTALGDGVDSTVLALTVYNDGNGPALFVGGDFQVAGGHPSLHIAKYSCAPPTGLSLPALTEIPAGTTAALPITLSGTAVASTAFSIDYDESCLNPDIDGDGTLDNLISFIPADFTVTSLFDPADADGEIDLSIADSSPPIITLPPGDLLSIDFQATCTGSPTTPVDAPVRFSLDPSPTFGDADAQVLPGTWSDGIVRIWPGLRGDCNGSGALEAPDLTAVGLEIFDDDGDFWTGAPGSDFVGSPVGCDANASTLIRAADVVCTNLLIFGGTCSVVDLQQDPPELMLSTQVEAAPDGELLWVRVEVNQMQSVASLAFSLELDPAQFDFAAVDVDSDGVPEHLRHPQGVLGFSILRWSDDGELDVLLAELSGQELPEGRLLEIGIPLDAPWAVQGIELSQTPEPSFGSTTGGDVAGKTSLQLGLFADGFESGDVSRWSSVVDTFTQEK